MRTTDDTARNAPPPCPAIGVGVVLFDQQDQVLLIKRNKAPAMGLWSIPGGRLEPGECLVAACRREVLEETGIAVEPGSIIAVAERISQNFHYVIIDFVASLKAPGRQMPCAASDVSDARWVDCSGLDQYHLVEGLAVIIECARHNSVGTGHPTGLIDVQGKHTDFIPFARNT